jgi:hypothetical protein
MKKNPLYLIPILAFALSAPPAVNPPAASAGKYTSQQLSPDQDPEPGKWTKIEIKTSDSKYESKVFYMQGPKSVLTAPPIGSSNYRRLYLHPNGRSFARSSLWYGRLSGHSGSTWWVNWYYHSADGHTHIVVSRAVIKEITVDPKPKPKPDPWADISADVKKAVQAAAPKASQTSQLNAARVLDAVVDRTGDVIGSKLLGEFQKRGPTGVDWANKLLVENDNDVQRAAAAMIQGFAKDKALKDDIAKLSRSLSTGIRIFEN